MWVCLSCLGCLVWWEWTAGREGCVLSWLPTARSSRVCRQACPTKFDCPQSETHPPPPFPPLHSSCVALLPGLLQPPLLLAATALLTWLFKSLPCQQSSWWTATARAHLACGAQHATAHLYKLGWEHSTEAGPSKGYMLVVVVVSTASLTAASASADRQAGSTSSRHQQQRVHAGCGTTAA